MDENMRSRLAESVRSFHIPRLGEIPDVGLYLEQVTRYVNQSITGCGLSPITASMVSNYVKQKIIPGPEKKAYGAESIAYLIFVSCIKSVGRHPRADRHSARDLRSADRLSLLLRGI